MMLIGKGVERRSAHCVGWGMHDDAENRKELNGASYYLSSMGERTLFVVLFAGANSYSQEE